MRVADAVGQGLAKHGAEVVFGVVGSGNFHVTNALIAGGARFVAARHEGGATVMADAWARTAGRPGVVSVHQGPGLTNAMTGIAEAAKSRTPLLVLAAEAPEVRSNFHVDVAGLAAAVGAVTERLYSPASALADVHRAYQTALGRRTVILAMPLNVQAATWESGTVQAAPRTYPPAPSAEAVTAVAAVLRGSVQPVFIAGRGALMGVSELETVTRLGIPMVVVVYDDEAYGAEVHHFGPDGDPLDTVRFPPTDIAAIGRGFGCDGVTVRGARDLGAVRGWLEGPRERPLLIDAKVTSSRGSWWLEEAFRGH